jgi:dihydrofolate reductase
MRRVVAAEYVTPDGVMQDPGGVGEFEHGGWHYPYFNDEVGEYQDEQFSRSDALLLGRITFEGFAAAWPALEETEGEMAVKMNRMPKFVASRTLKEPLEWNGNLLKGDLAEEVAKLKRESGQDLLIYGSGELVNALLPHNLIDEFRIMIFPIVIGSGKKLFRDGAEKTDLTLRESRTTKTGVALLTHQPTAGPRHEAPLLPGTAAGG